MSGKSFFKRFYINLFFLVMIVGFIGYTCVRGVLINRDINGSYYTLDENNRIVIDGDEFTEPSKSGKVNNIYEIVRNGNQAQIYYVAYSLPLFLGTKKMEEKGRLDILNDTTLKYKELLYYKFK
jgi:hypothetical protein